MKHLFRLSEEDIKLALKAYIQKKAGVLTSNVRLSYDPGGDRPGDAAWFSAEVEGPDCSDDTNGDGGK